jgi:shikimate dehydrogenase
MMSEPAVKRLGIIGDPVEHSISPAMQQPALDALGLAIRYERWHTPLSELEQRIGSLRSEDVLGANVTVPHKQAVIALMDEISPLAQAAGAVNTIVNRHGTLFGDNTDVYGFKTSLLETIPDAANRNAVILGAGGASRAVVLALHDIGVPKLTIVNRSRERAEQLVSDLHSSANVTTVPDDVLEDAGILINATSLGWHRNELPIDASLLQRLPPGALVVDLTYRDTDLIEAARAMGLPTLDGLGMLVHQGVLAFERFTGRAAPVEIMWNAARAARAPRV